MTAEKVENLTPSTNNESLLADSLSDISKTFQIFAQSVSFHLRSIDERLDSLESIVNDKIVGYLND